MIIVDFTLFNNLPKGRSMDEVAFTTYGIENFGQKHNSVLVYYLPENDKVRYTISPEARKEVLKRLLELNHKIYAEEVAAGLWEKKKSATKKKAEVKNINPDQGGCLKLNFKNFSPNINRDIVKCFRR